MGYADGSRKQRLTLIALNTQTTISTEGRPTRLKGSVLNETSLKPKRRAGSNGISTQDTSPIILRLTVTTKVATMRDDM